MSQLILILLMVLFAWDTEGDFIANYEKHFGSQTPYRTVENNNTTPVEFPGCQPKRIWYIIRHGARAPTNTVIGSMKQNLPRIAQIIINAESITFSPQIEELKKWKLPFDTEAVLTTEGKRELSSLATRTKARFPTLFPEVYSKTHYYFRHTNVARTQSSAQSFTFGLFGNEHSKVEYATPPPIDLVLQFYKTCPRYDEEVDRNVNKEAVLFSKSERVKNVIASVNERLNLNGTLSFDDVNSMYQACVYEAASYKKSVWCSLLPFEAIEIYDFLDSLNTYYENGYTFEVTYKQACTLFKSMIDHFERKEDGPICKVYFAHHSGILKFYAHLGLFKDGHHLNHTDYEGSYQWDASKIGSFATNIAFVLYNCSGTEKVAVLFQERVITLPNCSELCDFESIKRQYKDSINNCMHDQICK
ncbi:hypothetical protein PPYR_13522 [Photinus pyralis]|uniref:Uncharacterized protein n=2 Tax=Photinus pyralis TaxID=7054 RepID=A0A1Y1LV78_PHOPY|nr:hypothetical protein PPYR_13522 [Photinus pyralis]